MKSYLSRLALILVAVSLVFPSSTVSAQTNNAETVDVTQPASRPLKITSPDVIFSGLTNHPYSYTFTATGGTAPYTWETMTQPLNTYPCCLIALHSNGLFASVGPTSSDHMPHSGTYQIGVKVTDARGHIAEKVSQFTIMTSTTAPTKYKAGSVENILSTKISGWTYDNDRSVDITLSVEEVNTRKTYKFTTVPTIIRPEVATYLSDRFGIGGILVPLGFEINPSATIIATGTYRIKSINYNGNKFDFEVKPATTFTIGQTQTDQPSAVIMPPPTMQLQDGDNFICGGDRTIYYYHLGQKEAYTDLAIYQIWNGNSFASVKAITTDECANISEKGFVRLPQNTMVRVEKDPTIYRVEGNQVRPFTNYSSFSRDGLGKAVHVVSIDYLHTYPRGMDIK